MYIPASGTVADRALRFIRSQRRPVTLREVAEALNESPLGMTALMKYALRDGLCKRERLIGEEGLRYYWSVRNPFFGVDIDSVHRGR